MRISKKYAGVVIPMVTPITEDGKIDQTSAVRIFDHLVESNTFPFLLGTTGEAASVPMASRIELIKCVMDQASEESLVYAGISDNCLENSLFLAQKFADLGVGAGVAHLPSYYPLSDSHMIKYYEMLADKSPLPIIIYNILSTTHMSIPLDVIDKLSHHPNIMGMKDSERDLDRMRQSAEMFSSRKDFSILCGWTTQSSATLAMGFDGIVPNPGNITPGLFKALYDSVLNGRAEDAEKLQEKANEIADIFQKDRSLSQVFAGLKLIMSILGLCEPWVLPPLIRLNAKEEEQIQIKMEEKGIVKEQKE